MNQESPTKKCSICQEEKSLSFFNFRNDNQKYRENCKLCQAQKNKQWRIKTNHDYNRYWNNLISERKRHRKLYQKHKEKYQLYGRTYYHSNINYYIVQSKTYKQTHRKEINAHRKLRKKTDPSYLLIESTRTSIINHLKSINKSDHTIDLLGCTNNQYCLYLESLFTEGMSWKNYGHGCGKWNIDHIIPCSFFKDYFGDPAEQHRCFHYTNTRPLWSNENLSKSDKVLQLNYNDPTPFLI
jgi:hypothetical protein